MSCVASHLFSPSESVAETKRGLDEDDEENERDLDRDLLLAEALRELLDADRERCDSGLELLSDIFHAK